MKYQFLSSISPENHVILIDTFLFDLLETSRGMVLRRVIIVFLLLIVLPISFIETSEGQPIDISVGQSSVQMNMNLVLAENLTSLPPIDIYLTQSNSTSILQPINTAFQRLVPSTSIEKLELRAHSTNSSGMWLLIENYSITLNGASTNSGSSMRSNLSFIMMNVSQSLAVSNQELNAVGPAYLLAPLDAMDPKTTVYYIDGHQTLSAVIPDQTTVRFWLLDLTWVPQVSGWTETSDALKQTTSWSIDFPGPRYNLTLGRKSPEGPLIKTWIATYNPSFSVSVPANAWIDGNTVSFDTPTQVESAMPILIAISLTALVATFLVDRRFTKGQRVRKKKR